MQDYNDRQKSIWWFNYLLFTIYDRQEPSDNVFDFQCHRIQRLILWISKRKKKKEEFYRYVDKFEEMLNALIGLIIIIIIIESVVKNSPEYRIHNIVMLSFKK